MWTNLTHFEHSMPTLPPPKMPMRQNDSFHIALLILCAVGFLVLYFKVDLDGSLNASYIANVSQQVERVERRMMMAERKMDAMRKPPVDQAGMIKPPAMKVQGDGVNPNGGGVMDGTGQIRMQ